MGDAFFWGRAHMFRVWNFLLLAEWKSTSLTLPRSPLNGVFGFCGGIAEFENRSGCLSTFLVWTVVSDRSCVWETKWWEMIASWSHSLCCPAVFILFPEVSRHRPEDFLKVSRRSSKARHTLHKTAIPMASKRWGSKLRISVVNTLQNGWKR